MKIFVLEFFFLIPIVASAQSATFHELHVRTSKFGYVDSVIYPLILTGNKSIDERINQTIRDTMLDPDFYKDGNKISAAELIDSFISIGLTSMSWESTFNRNGILSIHLNSEFTSAYISNWTTYFNFNLNDGHLLSLDELLDQHLSKSFMNFILQKKIGILDSVIVDMRMSKEYPNYVNWAIEYMDSCKTHIYFHTFYFVPSGLIIKDDCDFPHAIQNMEPVLEFTLTHSQLALYLKSEVYNKLVN